MTERWDPDPFDIYADLGGLFEVAQALGVSVKQVKIWTVRRDGNGCPKPVRVLAGGHIYSISEWQAWRDLWKVTRARHGRRRRM